MSQVEYSNNPEVNACYFYIDYLEADASTMKCLYSYLNYPETDALVTYLLTFLLAYLLKWETKLACNGNLWVFFLRHPLCTNILELVWKAYHRYLFCEATYK